MIRVVDVETTGLEPTSEVIELGWTDLALTDGAWAVGATQALLVDPGVPIEFEAMATHHIRDEDVKGAPLLTQVWRDHFAGRDDIEALAAHHAKFEAGFLVTDLRWLCTWKCSVMLAPNFKSHKNQVLRYALKLDVDPARASPPHRAGPDSYVTAVLLARILNKLTVAEALEISEKPLLLPRLSFGKHEGVPCADVPRDYWEWVVKNITDNEDVQFTARHFLSNAGRQRIVPADGSGM